MKISYTSSSVYYNTPVDSQGRLGIWVPRTISSSTSDQIITISAVYNLRPDLMAYDMYGDPNLWWVFAQRNPNSLAADPLNNFVTGLQIYVPNAQNLKSFLGL